MGGIFWRGVGGWQAPRSGLHTGIAPVLAGQLAVYDALNAGAEVGAAPAVDHPLGERVADALEDRLAVRAGQEGEGRRLDVAHERREGDAAVRAGGDRAELAGRRLAGAVG